MSWILDCIKHISKPDVVIFIASFEWKDNVPFQRLKVAILPLDLPCSGLVTLSREIWPLAISKERSRTDIWRDFWICETGTSQQVARVHDRYMMMMMMMRWDNSVAIKLPWRPDYDNLACRYVGVLVISNCVMCLKIKEGQLLINEC